MKPHIKTVLFVALLATSGIIYAQKKQEKIMSNKEIVTTFLNGFNDVTKISTSMSLLAEDYKFKNPMVQLESKSEFIELANDIGKVLTSVEIISIADSNEWVSVMYIFKSSIPGVESNLATEWFRIENGIIKESILIYDASEWRKIYANMGKN